MNGLSTASVQLAPGIKAIQVRDVDVHDFSTSCFHLVRPDGSAEDFSTRKCLATLFPLFGASPKMVRWPICPFWVLSRMLILTFP